MTDLELLAPARNADIGIAAIDCGADAVYIAGPSFGARQAAGNDVADIRRLTDYAHRYGARVFVTVNTIVYDEEIPELGKLLRELADAGADAFIVQDMAVQETARQLGLDLPLHASTQCAIRTPEKASFLSEAGFSRLILERELSLEDIKSIREVTKAELEFFVHGALCVCYSGNCYLSEYLSGRSANRGACIQACRSLYDLEDAEGRTILKNKAVLSLKDYNLCRRLGDLAEAGITSFKIEGRLKNISYVKNVVRAYSKALDVFIASHKNYRRASFGHVEGGFEPDLNKTFNRGYTELFLDGRRGGGWASMDAAKGMGEYVGSVENISRDKTSLILNTSLALSNGDGLSFVMPNGEIVGFRADVCEGRKVICNHPVSGLFRGAAIYRNLDAAFEKNITASPCKRVLNVSLDVDITPEGELFVRARSEDGREASVIVPSEKGLARDKARMESVIRTQLSKTSEEYNFRVASFGCGADLPFLSAAEINAARRTLAERLSSQACGRRPLAKAGKGCPEGRKNEITYKDNVANALSREFYGAIDAEEAYELSHKKGIELMRTKYCVRAELGLCQKDSSNKPGPLYITNNGRRLALKFDCRRCEMTVSEA